MTSCVSGSVQNSCTAGSPASSDATCNGIDEDCSGAADEDYSPSATSCGVGACASTGTTSCVSGSVQNSCTAGSPASSDATCNGVDDDCSGAADEDYSPSSTSCGVGACAATGTTSCVGGTVENSCAPGSPASSDATCDGVDDDCSGAADEDYVASATTCGSGVCADSGVTSCVAGVELDGCVAGASYGLDDDNPCTDDACDPVLGVSHLPSTAGTACEDGDPCTFDDECDGAGSCDTGTPAALCEDRCADGTDDDGDEQIDCADVDCAPRPICDESLQCADGLDNDGDTLVDCGDTECTGQVGCTSELCANGMDDDGDLALDCADSDCSDESPCSDDVADPDAVAPELDATVVSGFAQRMTFLYDGSSGIQQGVASGAIEEARVALVSGSVVDEAAAPLSGVVVKVVGAPELGTTLTQDDGEYDLAVNGGGRVVLSFSLPGYLSSERVVDTSWHKPVSLEPVVLVTTNTPPTLLDLSGASGAQIVRGAPEEDVDGERRGVLVIPPHAVAQVTLNDGTVIPPGETEPLQIRIKEFTVGDVGPVSMPIPLPPTSAYTYAFEIAVEGVKDVSFDAPVPFYLENFIGLPVGTEVPLGSVDRERAVWVPSDSGRVIEIVGVTDGLAEVDADGDGDGESEAALLALGITASERVALASEYSIGSEIWRLQLSHFTQPWDANMGFWPPALARAPNVADPQWSLASNAPTPCTVMGGSTVQCQSRVLSEDIPVTGTPYALHYGSDRVRGAGATPIEIAMEPLSVLQGIGVSSVSVEFSPDRGKPETKRFILGQSNFPEIVAWDWAGIDAFDHPTNGTTHVGIDVRYYFPCSYTTASRFGYNGNGAIATNSPAGGRGSGVSTVDGLRNPQPACSVSMLQKLHAQTRLLDYRTLGLGGWSLSPHHVLDTEHQTLFLGSGEQLGGGDLSHVVNTHVMTEWFGGNMMRVAPDGSLYMSVAGQPYKIRHVFADGSYEDIGRNCFCALQRSYMYEGMQVEDLCLPNVTALDVTNDGEVLLGLGVPDNSDGVIIRIDRAGVVHAVAGSGGPADNPLSRFPTTADGITGPSTTLRIRPTGAIFASADGRVFHSGGDDPNGNNGPLLPYRGVDQAGDAFGLGIPSGLQLAPSPLRFAAAPDGSVYFTNGCGIERLMVDGTLKVVAGVRLAGYDGFILNSLCRPTSDTNGGSLFVPIPEDVDASTLTVPAIMDMTIDDDGVLYFATHWNQVHAIFPNDNSIHTILGNPAAGPCMEWYQNYGEGHPNLHAQHRACFPPVDGISAIQSRLPDIVAMDVGPDGKVYVALTDRVLVVESARTVRSSDAGRPVIPSRDGSELYVFDGFGRHLETRSALTGATLLSFEYDTEGRLEHLVDANGLETTIERHGNGTLSAIVAPFGQRTELTENVSGYLEQITPDPDSDGYGLTYDALGGGLLKQLVDPLDRPHDYTYEGHDLATAEAPDGRVQTLDKPDGITAPPAGVTAVTSTLSDAGMTRYDTDVRTPGTVISTVTAPDSTVNRLTQGYGDAKVDLLELADGTRITTTREPDALYGMHVPVEQTTVRLPSNKERVTTVFTAATQVIGDPSIAQTRTTTVTVKGSSPTAPSRTSVSTMNLATMTAAVESPMGRVSELHFDTLGRVTQVNAPGRVPVTLHYDTTGRVDEVSQGTGALARTTTATFFPTSGYLESLTQTELDETTTLGRDPVGRVTSVTNPASHITGLHYDAMSNVDSVTPPGRSPHVLGYSAADQLASYTPPDPNATTPLDPETREHTLHRKLKTLTRPDGSVVDLDYRTDGKLGTRTTSRGVLTYGYHTTSGKVTSVTGTGAVGLGFSYDGALPTTETWSGAVNGSVTRGYDDSFWLRSLSVNGSVVADYDYDDDGLLTEAGSLVLDRDSTTGDLTGTTLGVVTTSETISEFGELDDYVARVSDDDVFQEQVTERDGHGRIVERVETVQGVETSYRYGYDGDGRLHRVERDEDLVATYDYDENGNRVSVDRLGTVETGDYDEQDRLETYGTRSYEFGASGDLQSMTDSATSETTAYDYDELGNLRSVTLPDETVIEYEIDARDRRVGKKVDGVVQWRLLYLNQLEPIAMLDASGAVTAVFVYGSRGHVPDFVVKGGVAYRYVVDGRGSVRLVVNTADGSVAQRIDYDEFGKATLVSGSWGFQPFGFAGGLYDGDTALVRFGARDYDAISGRWTAKDPILFSGKQGNLYLYVHGDPVNSLDPGGLWGVDAGVCGRAQVWTAGVDASAGMAVTPYQENSMGGKNYLHYNYDASAIRGMGLEASVGAYVAVFLGDVGAYLNSIPTTISTPWGTLSIFYDAAGDWSGLGFGVSTPPGGSVSGEIPGYPPHNSGGGTLPPL